MFQSLMREGQGYRLNHEIVRLLTPYLCLKIARAVKYMYNVSVPKRVTVTTLIFI